MSIKAYKGFNKDMTCRGFQFEEGKTYHEDEAKLCEKGFHACTEPLDCFNYYSPAESVYHVVELDDVSNETLVDSKICGKTLKVGAVLDVAGIVKAQIKSIETKIIKKAASAQGDCSAASAQGNCSAASAQSNCSAASTQGYSSVAATTGEKCSATSCKGSISIGWGKDNRCKGEIGSYIILIERGDWDGEKFPQIGEPKLKKVDGKTIKPDTWYTLKSGKFVEVEEGED